MSNSSFWPVDSSLPVATTPGQSRPENVANEEVLRIPQSSNLLYPHHQNFYYHIHDTYGGVLPLHKNEVIVFYSPR